MRWNSMTKTLRRRGARGEMSDLDNDEDETPASLARGKRKREKKEDEEEEVMPTTVDHGEQTQVERLKVFSY